MKTISLLGAAGQGMKLLGIILAKILESKGYHAAITFEHDSFVRAGNSNAYLVFSKRKVDNPIIDDPDLTYDVKTKELKEELLRKYNDPKAMNMTLLGKILKELKIGMPENIETYLPKRNAESNKKAIEAGYA